LIHRFRKMISLDSSVIKGSGDDCAVLKYKKGIYQLFTCDMIMEGIDFEPDADPFLIGRKALAVSISDIASCGGIPRDAVVSIGVPGNFKLSRMDGIARGMSALARFYGINIVGGDISGADKLIIDVSMLGTVGEKYLVLRGGARDKDIIFSTGSFGGSISGKHLRFTPRVKESQFLVRNFSVHSMIDVSDGLIQDLGHILEESKARGAIVFDYLVPQSAESRGLDDALYSGEDFELLFTVSPSEAENILKRHTRMFHPVGIIDNSIRGIRLENKQGCRRFPLKRGFRHF